MKRWVVYGLVFLFLLAALGFWGVRTFQSKVSGDSAFWESAIVDFEESDALRPRRREALSLSEAQVSHFGRVWSTTWLLFP